jgi:hypothetical protein
MRVSKRLPMVAAIVFSLGWLFFSAAANSAAQSPDDSIAALALGPQWKQLSRRSEMIFTATVVAPNAPSAAKQIPKLQPAAIDHLAPAQIEIRFQVDEPIAGVQRGQIVTVHEWSGAASRHRPLAPGDRILLFLYPPSRLGLTSPVGGSRGLFGLDSTGKILSANASSADRSPRQSLPQSLPRTAQSAAAHCGSVLQLERAIRSARKD